MRIYHGTPITPATAAVKALSRGHAFISFAHPETLGVAVECCSSFAVDNGAFSFWKSGKATNWDAYYAWAFDCLRTPSCDFCVIPDVIDGSEEENDALLGTCPLPKHSAAPVWHVNESVARLRRLAECYPRVCIGSAGAFRGIGSALWWGKMTRAFVAICDEKGRPITKVHGLRMLKKDVLAAFPFSSADSTTLARNIGMDSAWKGGWSPPTRDARALVLREFLETVQVPATFPFMTCDWAAQGGGRTTTRPLW